MQRACLSKKGRGLAALLCAIGVAAPAAAIDFWDGRIQIHGYYEQQMRYVWEDFSGANDVDMGEMGTYTLFQLDADDMATLERLLGRLREGLSGLADRPTGGGA